MNNIKFPAYNVLIICREFLIMQRVRNTVGRNFIYGVDGRNVTVAVLDTGVMSGHPDLAGRLLCFRDFIDGRKFPYDNNGHGTHVCGLKNKIEDNYL